MLRHEEAEVEDTRRKGGLSANPSDYGDPDTYGEPDTRH